VIPIDTGRGMGLVVADLEERGRLDVFISNDTNPNALLRQQEPVGSSKLRFLDEAALRGCATNGAGRVQAGMGIASGDLTGDGRPDLFVTNFLHQTNTLYIMFGDAFFQDRSAQSGADAGSLDMLTFGTQSLDADCDGDLDLVLVNGHVDDFTHTGAAWMMPPAAYENRGGGSFQRLQPESLGHYGTEPRLGRAVARLDWNSDGRDDLAVTHLDRPPAILENQTPPAGPAKSLILKGTRSGRFPAGAIAHLLFRGTDGAERETVIHLTAGDGYYCSNEHLIRAATSGQSVVSVEIHWPSGNRQELSLEGAGPYTVVVEGCPRVFSVPQ
jgi:FG-GAP-like repeat/ASPIC and UnbV